LDAEYKATVNLAATKTLLFGDRFPFRYLMDDYGLTPYAAFSGCSAETEASFDTIVFLARKVDELNLKTVMVTESSDKSIARTVINNTIDKNQQILVLDAMQSVTANEVKDGTTYLSIMEDNLTVLKDALK
jgi:zinc transport system substrate-binding protein